ncbi:MAG: restriction endonuclease subunit S [Oscillospiraceae bacterium]
MTKLEKLIEELCPNGVKLCSVGELINSKAILTITPSFKIKRNDYKEVGTIPIISQEVEYISGYCENSDIRITQREYVCFGDHSENIKYVDFAFVQGADGLKIMYTDKSKLIARFFYYSVLNFYKYHNNYERHFKYFLDTIIPVPPLEVQREIVKILDEYSASVTALQKELEAELEARNKQYEYYRDKLLSFKEMS